jgi:carbon-monoxide dehydrogenase large subunit
MTVYQSTQAPHMMQDIFSRHLNIPESNIRVICPDVGGSFGIKVHVYADEMATAAISVMLKRPVKFVADRIESFLTDIHAREHKINIKLACSKAGDIIGFELRDLTGIGPFSVYPRTSGIEGNQVVNLTGGPYRHRHYKAHLDVVFTNKNLTCQYRAVGHPIAVAVTEAIVDVAAREIGMDPAEFRRRNLIADDQYPYSFPSGLKFEKLSHQQCLDKLLKLMDYPRLRQEQSASRAQGIYRGIGLAAMIEVTNPSPAFYGVGGARISAQDGATLRLDSSGMLNVLVSVTEQGQGTEAIFAQIAASVVGVSLHKVRVITGDTAVTPEEQALGVRPCFKRASCSSPISWRWPL